MQTHIHTVATQMNRTLHKDPVAHARMIEYLWPSAGSRTTTAGHETDYYKVAKTLGRTLVSAFTLPQGTHKALGYIYFCDLISLVCLPTADVSALLQVQRVSPQGCP